jgi:hypothetical protein
MSAIRDLCERIVKHATALGLKTEESMLPGLSEKKIRSLTAKLPFILPRSVIELYKWSAGQKSDCGIGCDFIPGYGMDSLPGMLEMYRLLSTASDYPRFRVGDLQWFPIFRSGGTDFYGVCCGQSAADDREVVKDDNEGPHRDCVTPPLIEFVSVEAMLRTLLRCYETGVFYRDKHGQVTVGIPTYFTRGQHKGQLKDLDLSRYKEVGRLFNPGLACWE